MIEIPPDFPAYCRIGALAALLGENTDTIRYWESEFAIKPDRSKSGWRVYSLRHVAKFIAIHDLLRNWNFTVLGARRRLSSAVKQERGTRTCDSP